MTTRKSMISPDGKVELNVLVFSNRMLYGSISGKNKNTGNSRPDAKKAKKKDPEDNLGNVITTLDTSKIERGVDFIDLNRAIESFLEKNDITYREFFNEKEFVLAICDNFELTLREFISIMVENKPDVFTIGFLRSTVKPFILKLKDEQTAYENEEIGHGGYHPLFDLL